MRRFLPILCLLLAACDREEHGKYDASRSSNPSSRATGSSRTPLDPLAKAVRRADNDPEMGRLTEEYQQELAAFIKSQESDQAPLSPPDLSALAAYYARHHPDAGLVSGHFKAGVFRSTFIKTLYEIDPEVAFRMIDAVSTPADKELYLESLSWAARDPDLDRIWRMLDAPEAAGYDLKALKDNLIAAVSSRDPDAGWLMWQQRMSGEGGIDAFLRSLPVCGPDTPYPVHLLDQIPDTRTRLEMLTDALGKCLFLDNVAPLRTWLDALPAGPGMNEAYARMATWRQYDGVIPPDRGHWLEKITDPDLKRETAEQMAKQKDALQQK